VSALPDEAVESFSGVANLFSLRPLGPAEKGVDVGAGAGLDSFVATRRLGRLAGSSASI